MTTVTPTKQLPKSYTPADAEPEVRRRWEASAIFHVEPRPGAKPYCILIPPPNVTAALHLGHALNNTLQDVLIRVHRMKGFNTLWMPGTDHAGIATQTVVDKRLQSAGEPALKDFKQMEARGENGREKFIAKVSEWKDEYEARITEQLKRIGASCDWDRQRFTMDDMCAKAVREAFFRLFKDGLIYRGKRLVNWDPVTQTALADDEVEMKEVDGKFWYLRYPLVHPPSNPDDPFDCQEVTWSELAARGYPVPEDAEHGDDKNAWVTVATTRPETYLGDTAVAVNPKDPRAVPLDGLMVQLPIVGRVIPIITDEYVVMPADESNDPKAQYATGFLKVTPAHDPNDWEIGQRHDLQQINVMAPDASISDEHGWDRKDRNEGGHVFVGLSREEARKKVVREFEARGLLEAVKPHRHAVGHSYRSHVPIEPYLSDQWYVKVTDDRLAGEALRALNDDQYEGEKPKREAASGEDENQNKSGTGVSPVPVTDKLQIRKRNLPHWELGGSTYFITFRLREGELSADERQIVLDACLYWHEKKMTVHLITIMPDHAHLLVTPLPLDEQSDQWHSLTEILHSIKSYSAHEIQKLRDKKGPLWQDESFDRIVRDEEEFLEKWNYMIENPLRAGIVNRVEDYQFTVQPHGTGETPVPPFKGREGDGELTFYPARYAKMYQSWHAPGSLRDWCISRQLWWGHRIPVWHKRVTLTENNWSNELLPWGWDSFVKGNWRNEGVYATVVCVNDGTILDPKNAPLMPVVPETEGEYDIFVCLTDEAHWKPILEESGFTQDPDVLDTWFSSGLWPLSTMGWPTPEQYPDTQGLLDTFNPTSVLCTGRDIITLWVSRMVMFNRYFNAGKVPFHHVYINPMIQDGHGQRMSKSLGNGVDPLDIVHSHGADAMRFSLTQIATSTQDVRLPVDLICEHCGETFHPKETQSPAGYRVAAPKQQCPSCKKHMISPYGYASGLAQPTDDAPLARNTSSKFDIGRNFCNKLWNATRFALSNLTETDAAHVPDASSHELSLADKWMLTRLSKTLEEIEGALREYQFSAYAQAMYDFVWRDFCDWYLESIKPTVKERPAQQQVLLTVLNSILRMLHPICPFVTETLWPNVRHAGHAGLDGVELTDHELLAGAGWPRVDASVRDLEAEATYERVQNLVSAIRQVRAENNVPPKRKIDLSIKPELQPLVEQADGVVEALAGLESIRDATAGEVESGAVPIPFEGDEVLLGGVRDAVDVDAERKRLEKIITEKKKAITGYRNRLSNENYVNKAPEHVVEETRQRLEEAENDLAAARQALEALQG